MKILNDIKSARDFLKQFSKKEVGFVPTMGALHQGHMSLINLAKKSADIVVVSIFINQKQFSNAVDFVKYPNTLQKDIILLENLGVDAVFIPDASEIYSQNFLTKVSIKKLTNDLCGKNREGHFDGVALIVTKLFNIIKPQKAFFGEKDFQQLQIIRKLVFDLNFDIEIVSGKTLRENDGLAMSSRNLRLSDSERVIAGGIYKNLELSKQRILDGESPDLILQEMRQNLLKIGAGNIDYLQICDEENLSPDFTFNFHIKSRLFIAIYVGEIRLIDNITLY